MMDFKEVGCGGREWIELAQYKVRGRALVNAVMYLQCSIKCGEFLD